MLHTALLFYVRKHIAVYCFDSRISPLILMNFDFIIRSIDPKMKDTFDSFVSIDHFIFLLTVLENHFHADKKKFCEAAIHDKKTRIPL